MSESLPELLSDLGCMIKVTYKLVKTQKSINEEMDKLIAAGKIPEEMVAHYTLVKNDGKEKGVKREKGRTNLEDMQYLIDFAEDLEKNVALFPESAHDNIAVYIACIEQTAQIGAKMDANDAEKKAEKAQKKAAKKAEKEAAAAERKAAKAAEKQAKKQAKKAKKAGADEVAVEEPAAEAVEVEVEPEA